jgi:hypothetical protein
MDLADALLEFGAERLDPLAAMRTMTWSPTRRRFCRSCRRCGGKPYRVLAAGRTGIAPRMTISIKLSQVV